MANIAAAQTTAQPKTTARQTVAVSYRFTQFSALKTVRLILPFSTMLLKPLVLSASAHGNFCRKTDFRQTEPSHDRKS